MRWRARVRGPGLNGVDGGGRFVPQLRERSLPRRVQALALFLLSLVAIIPGLVLAMPAPSHDSGSATATGIAALAAPTASTAAAVAQLVVPPAAEERQDDREQPPTREVESGPDDAAAAASGLLAEGSRVELHSLVSPRAQELNGRQGVVEGWDAGNGRYTVMLDGRGAAAGKRANPKPEYVRAVGGGGGGDGEHAAKRARVAADPEDFETIFGDFDPEDFEAALLNMAAAAVDAPAGQAVGAWAQPQASHSCGASSECGLACAAAAATGVCATAAGDDSLAAQGLLLLPVEEQVKLAQSPKMPPEEAEAVTHCCKKQCLSTFRFRHAAQFSAILERLKVLRAAARKAQGGAPEVTADPSTAARDAHFKKSAAYPMDRAQFGRSTAPTQHTERADDTVPQAAAPDAPEPEHVTKQREQAHKKVKQERQRQARIEYTTAQEELEEYLEKTWVELQDLQLRSEDDAAAELGQVGMCNAAGYKLLGTNKRWLYGKPSDGGAARAVRLGLRRHRHGSGQTVGEMLSSGVSAFTLSMVRTPARERVRIHSNAVLLSLLCTATGLTCECNCLVQLPTELLLRVVENYERYVSAAPRSTPVRCLQSSEVQSRQLRTPARAATTPTTGAAAFSQTSARSSSGCALFRASSCLARRSR